MNWEEPGPLASEPVAESEILSHFLFRSEARADGSIKASALIPYPNEELSVTRHLGLTEDELKECAEFVAKKQNRTLKGHAQFLAGHLPRKLFASPSEPPRNHADILGWPSERAAQISDAQFLSAACGKCIRYE